MLKKQRERLAQAAETAKDYIVPVAIIGSVGFVGYIIGVISGADAARATSADLLTDENDETLVVVYNRSGFARSFRKPKDLEED